MDAYHNEDLEEIRRSVREFAREEIKPRVMEYDESQKFPLDIMSQLGEMGMLGVEVVLPDSMTGEGAHTDKTRFIPLVGSIAAGVPITADQQVEETFPLPESLVGKGELFMLKVKGESMINAGISPDDILIVDRALEPKDGKIVILLLMASLLLSV